MSQPRLRLTMSWAIAIAIAIFLVLSMSVGYTSATKSKNPDSTVKRISAASTQAVAEPFQKGKFESPIPFPADSPTMIHASVLPDGRVLFWGRDKQKASNGLETIYDEVAISNTKKYKVRIWDPVSGGFETVDNATTNLFCSGHSLLYDGRLFVAGGHKHQHPSSQIGDERTNIFNPVTKSWMLGPTMEKGRWYPFNVTLETGEVAILSGTYLDPSQPQPYPDPPLIQTQKRPEIYNPQNNTIELMDPSVALPTYPLVFLDPLSGTDALQNPRGVFIAGPRVSYFWNPRGGDNGKGAWSLGIGLAEKFQDGSAVMYDSDQGGVLMVGGRDDSGKAIPTAKKIILNSQTPQWESAGQMTHPRSWHTTTLLPDGNVLVTGGIPCYNGQLKIPCYIKNPDKTGDRSTYQVGITKTAEMWSPSGGWQSMATATNTRGYHSVALLLPDATVMVGGYGYPDGLDTSLGDPDPFPTPTPPPNPTPNPYLNERRQTTGERNVEIYKPHYLFDINGNEAPRPQINSAPTQVAYGQQFNVTFGGAATGINRVAWVRLPSVTHGFNQDQRINVLQHSITSPGVLTITAPSPNDKRKCPPGYYMLFIFNSSNVPSKAKIIRIADISREDFIARRTLTQNDIAYVFYRHLGDTTLRYMKQTAPDSANFTTPVDLGGGLNSNPIAVPNANGRLEVIVLGLDNTFYSTRQTAVGSDTWVPFQKIGAAPSNLPVIAAARNLDGRIQIFYRGGDNALWYIAQTAADSTTWTAPVSLGGGLTSEPSVGMNLDGRLEVFVRGLDNALYRKAQTSPGNSVWTPWSGLGGLLNSGPFVAHHGSGQLGVFVRGAGEAVYHIQQSTPNGVSWTAWQSLGGTVRGDHPYNTPVAMLAPSGRLQVFVRWSDDTLRTIIQNADGTFTANSWSNLWGAVNATLQPPARSKNGQFLMFARGGGGTYMMVNRQLDSNFLNWSGFVFLGDNAHSF